MRENMIKHGYLRGKRVYENISYPPNSGFYYPHVAVCEMFISNFPDWEGEVSWYERPCERDHKYNSHDGMPVVWNIKKEAVPIPSFERIR
jgi:hypothetical protein